MTPAMDDFLQVILEETEKVFHPSPGSSSSPELSIIDENLSDEGETILGSGISLTPIRQFPIIIQNGDRFHSCKYCPEKFTSKSDYTHHLQISHIDERPFQCLHCGKSFSTKNILKQHERIHTKERPYSCQYCKKTFSHRTALANHIRTHTGEKPFDCSYCEKSFGEKAKLLLHMRVHTGEKPFVCGHCQRAFRDKSSYNVHLRIHTGEKPFMCNYCQRSFTHRNSFKDHLRIHTGERPFVCVHCNRDFAKQSTLRKHLEVHGVVKPFELHVHAVIKPCSTAVPKDSLGNLVNEPFPSATTKSNTTATSSATEAQCEATSGASDGDPISPAIALSIIKRMLHVKKKPRVSRAVQRSDQLTRTVLTLLHRKQVHVCTFCRSLYESKHDLTRHSQTHSPESKVWKVGADAIQLFTSILGLDAAHALGFHERQPQEILGSFLAAAGAKPKLSADNCDPLVLVQSHFKAFLGLVVNRKEQDNIALDRCCVLNLLYDMVSIYPLCDDGV